MALAMAPGTQIDWGGRNKEALEEAPLSWRSSRKNSLGNIGQCLSDSTSWTKDISEQLLCSHLRS